MKRFHVHVAVEDLAQSVRFYSTLFAAEPSVVKPDYAKWMLDDPRVNFAISQRGAAAGIEHLGIQAENETELSEQYERLSRAGGATLEEKDASCCYARFDKQWIADPQGIAWETFLTKGESAIYGGTARVEEEAAACCTPTTAQGVCCPPKPELAADAPCCGPKAAA